MAFLDDYEPVEVRLARFWADWPEGRVSSDIIAQDDPTHWVVMASVYRNVADPHPAATGLAHELVTERGVNSTSALENCETSAIGRALANLGYAPKGARPSREEMTKAQRQEPPKPTATDAEMAAAENSLQAAADLEALADAWQAIAGDIAQGFYTADQKTALIAAKDLRKADLG